MSCANVGAISNLCWTDIGPMLVIAHVGQMMHEADVNHYLRNDAFNIRGRLAQLRRAWLNEVLYNLFLFTAIISNFSDYNFVGAFSQELLTKNSTRTGNQHRSNDLILNSLVFLTDHFLTRC